jgi:ATP-dependent phosphofructokinase / diphosphate-dependent phosphofructokinase
MQRTSGNAVVGQSGGPTAVINASLCGVAQAASGAGIRVLGMLGAIRGLLDQRLIDLSSEDPAVIAGLRSTPSSALGSGRHKLGPNDYDRLAVSLKRHDIRYFFYIGGNDSADTTAQVSRVAAEIGHELFAIAVPKTVDNDLVVTDHCPGYGSAARYVAMSILEAGFDSEAIASYPIKIIEVMGRHAGWLAAAGALAACDRGDAPQLVYVPERPIDFDAASEDVRRVVRDHGHVVISFAEGARASDGHYITDSPLGQNDSFGHRAMAGAGDVFASILEARTGIRARCDRPGTLQRSSMALASRTDVDEAYEVGVAAVEAAIAGRSGGMITLVRECNHPYRCTTGYADISEIANREKHLPLEFMNDVGNYPTDAMLEYARPLIGDPLPEYVRLSSRTV